MDNAASPGKESPGLSASLVSCLSSRDPGGGTKDWTDVYSSSNRVCFARSLVKVSTYAVEAPVIRLNYCSVLLGVSDTGTIFDVTKDSASYGSYSVLK